MEMSGTRFRESCKRGLGLRGPRPWALIAVLALVLFAAPMAVAQQSVLNQGNGVLTGFSGTAITAPASGDPVDSVFIDLNGASARILGLPLGNDGAHGQLIASPTIFAAKAGDIGQVFGIALDDGKGSDGTLNGTPDIYLTATSAFGLQIVVPGPDGHPQRLKFGAPGAQWMPGQWGNSQTGGTPGSIWKVNGTSGAITLFANVTLNGQANSGPGLGNIAFDARSRQMFVSDLGSGMIHRFDMHGQDLGFYDHGTQGRSAIGLPPVPLDPANILDITSAAFNVSDPATWHYAPLTRMVWGLKISAGRLYYAAAAGPQVWSVSIGDDGSFGNDPRLEIDVTGTPSGNAISDVTFDGPDTVYLAQRGAARGDYAYKTFAEPAQSLLMRYRRDPRTGKWMQAFEDYAVGYPPAYRNTNGGVAIDTCTSLVWSSGEQLRQGSGLPGPGAVNGLQGMDKSLVRPANQPPSQSYFADYDGSFDDPDVHGHMGDVEVWHPCQGTGALNPPFNLTLTKLAVPYTCPPGADCKRPPDNADPADCIPGGMGWLCSYKIAVTNTGVVPYRGPVAFNDWLPAAPAATAMSASATPAWVCANVGAARLRCSIADAQLNPGDSVSITTVVDLPKLYQDCYLNNAATLDWVVGLGDADARDDAAFAAARIPGTNCPPPTGNHTNLKIQKFAYGDYCRSGLSGVTFCGYLILVTNTGPGAYNDKITVDDTLPGGVTAVFSPPWSCTGTTPYSCTYPSANLNPGQSVGLWVQAIVPPGYLRTGTCDVPNKAHISYALGGSLQNTNPSDDDASATAHINPDRCHKPPPVHTCPGDLTYTGTQCKCPEGTTAAANYRCIKRGGDIGVPIPLHTCQPPLVGTYPNCHCPDERPNLRGGQCFAGSPSHCPAGSRGTYPDCTCISASETWNGSVCVPKSNGTNLQGGGNQAVVCPRPAKGTLPNCVCPGRETWNGSSCVFPPNGSTQGKSGNGPAAACPSPAQGTLPNCACPGRATWNGSACVTPSGGSTTGNTGGGQTKTHPCPAGNKWDGRNCVPIKLTPPGELLLKKLLVPNLGDVLKNQ